MAGRPVVVCPALSSVMTLDEGALGGEAAAGRSFTGIGILGGRASAKSSLLNTLFGTGFSVRPTSAQGICLQEAPALPGSLVVDVDAYDDVESRGERYFLRSALWLLFTCEVVVVNLFVHDIGRLHTVHNSLCRVLELFVAHFGQHRTSNPTLWFVVRDHCPDQGLRVDQVQAGVYADLQAMFRTVRQAQPHKQLAVEDVFEIRLACLPHAQFQRDAYHAAAAILASEIQEQCQSSPMAMSTQQFIGAWSSAVSLRLPTSYLRPAQALESRLTAQLDAHFRHLNADFWSQVAGGVATVLEELQAEQLQLLEDQTNDSDAVEEELEAWTHSVQSWTTEYIRDRLREAMPRLPALLFSKFEQSFRYDTHGLPRSFSGPQSLELAFQEAKRVALVTLSLVVPGTGQLVEGEQVFTLPTKTALRVQRQFDERCRLVLEHELAQMSRERASGGVPLWGLVIIAILGFNEFVDLANYFNVPVVLSFGLCLLTAAAFLLPLFEGRFRKPHPQPQPQQLNNNNSPT